MAIAINGSGTITGISAGGLPDNIITNAEMADDAIGIADLSATGTASSSTFLRGDNSWAAAGGGGKVLAFASGSTTTNVTGSEDTWVDTGLTVSITPTSSSSTIYVTSFVFMFGSCKIDSSGDHDGDFNFRLRVTPSGGSEATLGEEQHCRLGFGINGTYNHYTTQKRWQFSMHEQYSNSSTTAKTFKLQFMEENYSVLSLCDTDGRAFINAMEVA